MPDRFRLLVCGGRDYRDAATVARVLDAVLRKHGIASIIQGGADGADRLAAEWGWDHKIPVGTFNADWKAHGRAAGPIRNKKMLDEGEPDAVVAFPGGRGTADMVRQARAANIKVWEPLKA